MTRPCRRPTIVLRRLTPDALLALDLANDANSRRATSAGTCHGR